MSPIKKVTKTKESFELDLLMGDIEAKLVINESFFKSNRDVQIREYLISLSKFIETKRDIYPVSVYTFCMFDSYEPNETIIYASDFDKFYVSVSGKHKKPRKLDSFQALSTTGVWSN